MKRRSRPVKNSEFKAIMKELSWNGARGRPKGFANNRAAELPSETKTDLVKRIIKNGQALPVSLLGENRDALAAEAGYRTTEQDRFYGSVLVKS